MSHDLAARPGFVATELTFEVTRPATVVLQVAVAGDPASVEERLEIRAGATSLVPTVVEAPVGGRQHLVRADVGVLTVRYDAVIPQAAARSGGVSTAERIEALRPSRYCPSDRVLGLAARFADLEPVTDRVRAMCDHVADRTVYTVGASGPSTDGVDTLLSGAGVCRDYAHAMITLCRAVGVPARYAAVYAPGLSPMDLHAVVEVEIDGSWTVWDPTRLAPRPSLVRISTGRDAADTAFATVLDGQVELRAMSVTAVAPGDLPTDEHAQVLRSTF
ncbi:MAG TPA: transglutaminase-like domain-containing protein [Propionicimonas sp.]|jgi:transglutaminase-like putative cysteine protease